MIDRYEIGERQTSACGVPTEWLRALGLMGAHRQTFGRLVIHTRHQRALELPWTFSTFDYRDSARCWTTRTTRSSRSRRSTGARVTSSTPTAAISAPMVVDALGWKRMLAAGHYQPPDAPLSRGLEVHPHGAGDELEMWIDRRYVPAGYGWSFPARDEVRVGVGSFDPRFHVKDTTVLLAEDLERDAVRYQGNWIPHKLRDGTEDGVFFVGDSAGHCLPLTAEGIRTAFYFGIACGRELRAVVEGRQSIAAALARYHDFNEAHRWKFEAMLRAQRLVPRVPPRLLAPALIAMGTKAFVDWSFGHYLEIAPPSFAGGARAAPGPSPRSRGASLRARPSCSTSVEPRRSRSRRSASRTSPVRWR